MTDLIASYKEDFDEMWRLKSTELMNCRLRTYSSVV